MKRLNKPYTEGLSEQEVSQRKKQGMENTPPENITKTTGQIIKDNVCTVFNAFNLAIGICLALVGAWVNMIYLLIILANILIGILQEIYAKKLVEQLSLIAAPKAAVIRDGKEKEIKVEELVLDDIAVLRLGKQVCADSIVVHGEVEVNESLLTGESDVIVKKPGDSLLSGSFVVSGECYARVEHIGADNFISKLTLGAKKHKKITSELLRSMRKVTKFTGFFIPPVGLILFLQAYFMRANSLEMSVVLTAAALLGMLPKGLVLMISISLATGVIKLSGKNILVQEMYCIETLADVDMLCLDKTGTLTEGKMRVHTVFPMGGHEIPLSLEKSICYFTDAMGDSNATFAALKEKFPPEKSPYAVLNKVQFSSERKWSGVTFEDFGSIVMGAPEVLDESGCKLPKDMKVEQQEGNRVVYIGYTKEVLKADCVPTVKLVAAVSFCDPIRDNAKRTLDFFKEEGVAVKIISGDNPLTVSSIAQRAGLKEYASYIDMSAVHTRDEIVQAAEKYTIFGRVTPDQKKELVQALKAQGHTVAMTGDGVNDVLALREADCSIAIGAGSDAAKQISQLVLLDSDFSALPEVVMEGRRVINNITRSAGIFFIKTIYSMLLSIISIITASPFPFIPIQITLIDAVIEAMPAFFLSFEPDGKKPSGAFLPSVIKKSLPYSLLILFWVLSITGLSPLIGMSGDTANTMMYYLTGFITLMALMESCRPFNKIRVSICALSAVVFYAAAYLFADILSLQRLGLDEIIFFISSAILCVILQKVIERILAILPTADPA